MAEKKLIAAIAAASICARWRKCQERHRLQYYNNVSRRFRIELFISQETSNTISIQITALS